MNIASFHSRTVSASTSESTATTPFPSAPNDPQAITEAKTPSLFELLLSLQMGSSLATPAVVNHEPDSSTESTIGSEKPNDAGARVLKHGTSSIVDAPATILAANFIPWSNGPKLDSGAIALTSTPLGSTSDSFKSEGQVPTTKLFAPTQSLRSGGSNTFTISPDRRRGPSALNADDQHSPAENLGSTASPISDAATINENPDHQITNATAPSSPEPATQTVLPGSVSASEHPFVSLIPVEESLESKVEGSTKATGPAFLAGAAAIPDDLQVERGSAPAQTGQLAGPIPRPNIPAEKPSAPDDAVILTMNAVRYTNAESAIPVTDPIATAIVEQLGNETVEGPTSVRIRLDHPDLGTLDLHLSVTGNVVSVRIHTHDRLSQQIVESQINNLRQSLTTSGVECGQFQVDCHSNGRQFSGQPESGTSFVRTENPGTSRWTRTQTLKQAAPRASGLVNFVA